MPTPLPTRFAMLTDVGRVRAHNEDSCAADSALGLFVVCDGMGGAAGGEIASREAADAVLASARLAQFDEAPLDRMNAAIRDANRSVYQHSQREPRLRGMGTTVVALELTGNAACIAHAGDSRCYLFRALALQRLTDDHSLVEEQLRLGHITPHQARHSHLRNVITRVVGSNSRVEPEVTLHAVEPGDIFLLCSDGLTRDLSDGDLRSILSRHSNNLAHAARVMVDSANLLGGGDNITVVLVGVGDTEAGTPAPRP